METKDKETMEKNRKETIERYYNNSLQRKLLELMEILEPGGKIKWGAKKREQLVCYAAIYLAIEYQVLTGYPIVELLTDKRAVDDLTPQINDVVNPGVPAGPPPPKTLEEEESLPL